MKELYLFKAVAGKMFLGEEFLMGQSFLLDSPWD